MQPKLWRRNRTCWKMEVNKVNELLKNLRKDNIKKVITKNKQIKHKMNLSVENHRYTFPKSSTYLDQFKDGRESIKNETHDRWSWSSVMEDSICAVRVPIEGDRWITGGEIASEVPVVGVFTPLSVNIVLGGFRRCGGKIENRSGWRSVGNSWIDSGHKGTMFEMHCHIW